MNKIVTLFCSPNCRRSHYPREVAIQLPALANKFLMQLKGATEHLLPGNLNQEFNLKEYC